MMAGSGVKCWGLNNYGQLGIGSNTDQNRPVDVPGGQGLEWPLLSLLVPSHRDPPHPSPSHAFQTESTPSTSLSRSFLLPLTGIMLERPREDVLREGRAGGCV